MGRRGKVFWYCQRCGYEYKGVRPSSRARDRRGIYQCPKCGGHVTPGLPDKKWPEIRSEIHKRDSSQCLKCGEHWSKETPLVVHHIRPVAERGESYSENLITLCLDCHDKVHSTERWMRLGLLVPIVGWILVPLFIQRRRRELRELIREKPNYGKA